MRLQRLNYDKARRCPTWSGPALGGPIPKYEDTCPGGMITFTNKDGDLKKFYKFRFSTCPECGVITLPYYISVAISPSVWKYETTSTAKAFWRGFKRGFLMPFRVSKDTQDRP